MPERQIGTAGVLMRFFGRKPNQTLTEFAAEVNTLSKDEQIELAQLTAAELGMGQGEVNFPLGA
jgi:hypothetical protein